ncbi:hypothetical protein SELMODRAFT_443705 [Selaginella moellendorffii]|uniref:Uncharacterized protein n=1 Tax=Selaginella moellendorffii TaxID=88036 RepID=D8S3P9_SELML|nr:hypothetical protein SELMODRAFT_443705 [Selaginella moellendorffii]
MEAFSQTPLLDKPGARAAGVCEELLLNLIWAHSETSEIASVVVLGMPGISKSSFVFVVLWELLQKRCWNLILLKFKESNRYYTFEKDGKVSSLPSLRIGWRPKRKARCSTWQTGRLISTIGACLARLFIPMWSREEIHTLNDWVFKHPKAEVDKKFNKWGVLATQSLSLSCMALATLLIVFGLANLQECSRALAILKKAQAGGVREELLWQNPRLDLGTQYYAFNKDGKVTSTIDPVLATYWVEAEEEGTMWYLADWKFNENQWSLPCKTVIVTLSEHE